MGIKNEKKWYFEGVNKLLSFPDEVIDKEKYIEEFIQGFLEGHNDYITPENDDILHERSDFLIGYYNGKDEYCCQGNSLLSEICRPIKIKRNGKSWCDDYSVYDYGIDIYWQDNILLGKLVCINSLNTDTLKNPCDNTRQKIKNRHYYDMYVENLAKLKSILDDNKRDLDNTINYRQLKNAIQDLGSIENLYKVEESIVCEEDNFFLFNIIQSLLCIAYEWDDKLGINRLESIFTCLFTDAPPALIINKKGMSICCVECG